MLDFLWSPDIWLAFATLTALEIVLGIDNIIFIAILAGRLPEAQREKARKIGLAGAFVTRLGLLSILSWIVKLDQPIVHLGSLGVSGKAMILFGGGVFLLFKATKEIHHKLEAASNEAEAQATAAPATLTGVVTQIMLLDMVFSLDSVITAVGMSSYIGIMVAANVIALAVMLVVGGRISEFVERHPSVKILALSFLLMIGLLLVCEAFAVHVPKGYVYGAMGFSVFVELLNIRTTRKSSAVTLRQTPRTADIPH